MIGLSLKKEKPRSGQKGNVLGFVETFFNQASF